MKFTVFTLPSRSTASRNCLRKTEPLAPVVATVRFSTVDGNSGGSARHQIVGVGSYLDTLPRKLRIGRGERQVKERLDRRTVSSRKSHVDYQHFTIATHRRAASRSCQR